MSLKTFCVCAAALFAFAGSCLAAIQTTGPSSSASRARAETRNASAEDPIAYQMPGSIVKVITSDKLDRSYRLYIKFPPGYETAADEGRRYPTIYFNDATYTWLTAVGVTIFPFHTEVFEEAILVGISHAVDQSSRLSRTRDYTPTDDPGTQFRSGGARQYLIFLKDEVLPFIEGNYRADPARRALSGVSYGGLFGAYALLEEPGLFQDYILTSPSLWHNERVMFELEAAAAASGRQLSGRVYFATGEAEVPGISPGFPDMVGQQGEFARRLRNRGYPDLEVRDEVIAEGTHLTTYPIGLTRALRWMLPGKKPYSD